MPPPPTLLRSFPSAAYAEKRGSMINGRGRLQRLNRAVRPPGQAREDWEILRDLLQEFTGSNGLGSIEDVFRQMAESHSAIRRLELEQNWRSRRESDGHA